MTTGEKMLGQRYGTRIVTGVIDAPRVSDVRLKLRCDCGYEYEASAKHIRSGNAQSCKRCQFASVHKASIKHTVKIGDRFRKWTVIGEPFSRKIRLVECRCDCGRVQTTSVQSLIDGKTGACISCAKPTKGRGGWNFLWRRTKKGAKSRNLEFTITEEYAKSLYEQQGQRCALTGVPLYITSTHVDSDRRKTTASIDRIDSSKGYIPGNVQWLHKDVNRIKLDLEQEYFKQLCRQVCEHETVGLPSYSYDDQGI